MADGDTSCPACGALPCDWVNDPPVARTFDEGDVERAADVLKRYPVRCSDDKELDELRRREAARAALAALQSNKEGK